jgi:two-component system chemotaxis sensor kinase CheA
MSEELDEVMVEFITESYESLDELDRQLVTLEQESNPDSLASIFRAIHTIKGTSGFLGLSKLEALTHVGENLLSKLRDGLLDVTQEITTSLLQMVDAVREIIEHVEADGEEGDTSNEVLLDELSRLERGETLAAAPSPEAAPVPTEVADATPETPAAEVIEPAAVVEPEAAVVAEVVEPAAVVEPEAAVVAEVVESEAALVAEVVEPAPVVEPEGAVVAEVEVEPAAEVVEPVAEVVDDTPKPEKAAASTEDRHASAESIRVDVGLLDDLMNLVGELVLARNQILQYSVEQHDTTFFATTQRLNLITTELQEGVMRTRMQPIENVWNKFPRVVRDLTMACGKQARLEMEGKHTELDKTLLEAIKDPLTHLVRNSVDHGLESPEQRLAKGKPAEGIVRLRAYHEGGQVIIEISDDGGGIDPAVIRAKAAEKGLFGRRSDENGNLSDREVLNMIFMPGFSTAAQVTNISGRGVGMDVVRTNIEAIGGSVDVQSEVGVGTVFKIKIPLTLAIIPALVVTCEGERFAIPQVSLRELVRIDGHDPQSAIEYVQGAPVYRLRGRLLPIVYLHEVFGNEAPDNADGVNIVVVQADDREFGLVVDEISDTAEIVVKPLGRILKQVSAFAGATIMGDGKVALILDVLGIAESIGMGSSGERQYGAGESGDDMLDGTIHRMLMFRLGTQRLALLLEMVARLEEFTPDQVELTGAGRVVQYRDEIMPLVFVSEELGIASSRTEAEPLQVVVCMQGERSVGVVVDDIYDIVEQSVDIAPTSTAHGVLCSAVIQDRVIDILDVESVLRSAVPALFQEVPA